MTPRRILLPLLAATTLCAAAPAASAAAAPTPTTVNGDGPFASGDCVKYQRDEESPYVCVRHRGTTVYSGWQKKNILNDGFFPDRPWNLSGRTGTAAWTVLAKYTSTLGGPSGQTRTLYVKTTAATNVCVRTGYQDFDGTYLYSLEENGTADYRNCP